MKITVRPAGRREDWHKVMPFRRSWIAVVIVAVLDGVFVYPAVTTFALAANGWREFENLFDLVFALFLSAWLLGWIIAPLLLTAVLAVLILGREVISVRPGIVELTVGLPLIGVSAAYEAAKIRNLRVEHPAKRSGTSWRGSHFAFDYGAETVRAGSCVTAGDVDELSSRIHLASGTLIRQAAEMSPENQARREPAESMPHGLQSLGSIAEPHPDDVATPSSLALVLANLVPVAGTVFLGWRLSDVMVLYWSESAIIGFFNVCKIVTIGRWKALAAAPFFIGHFGGFMAVHFLFIYTIFVAGPDSNEISSGDLGRVAQVFVGLWPAVAALFFSHAFSFFTNFLGRNEYRGRTLKTQMTEPYNRIVFMHLVVIFGGGLTLIVGQAEPVILLVIGLKIIIDLKAHRKERASH